MSEAKPEQKAGTLDIKIKDQQENETFFKIKNHTKFGKVFDAYCDRQSLARNTVRFLFEGTRVQDTDTPESLDLEDGDMIQAMLEQVGGLRSFEALVGRAINLIGDDIETVSGKSKVIGVQDGS